MLGWAMTGLGDLDEHNGRFAVTPDSPGGAYAYYATTAANGTSAYPYLVGPTYRGVADTANFGSHQSTFKLIP